jgi:hypothetical protein
MPHSGVVKGYDGRVDLNGTYLNTDRYRWAWAADDIPGIGFEDIDFDGNLYDDGTTGVISSTLSTSGYWNLEQIPSADPPSIRNGSLINNVQVWISKTNNFKIFLTGIRILGGEIGAELRSRVEMSFTARSNGKISWPF